MRAFRLSAMVFLALLLAPLAGHAQEANTDTVAAPAAAGDYLARANLWMPTAPGAMPAILAPAARADLPVLQDGPGPVPVLFGIFGAIAGLFVADWWWDRDCGESCGQKDIPTLFLGGALGAILGYLIGGGEIPNEEFPDR